MLFVFCRSKNEKWILPYTLVHPESAAFPGAHYADQEYKSPVTNRSGSKIILGTFNFDCYCGHCIGFVGEIAYEF